MAFPEAAVRTEREYQDGAVEKYAFARTEEHPDDAFGKISIEPVVYINRVIDGTEEWVAGA